MYILALQLFGLAAYKIVPKILQRQEYLFNGWFPVSRQIVCWCVFEPVRRRCSRPSRAWATDRAWKPERWRQESEASGIINPSLIWVERAIMSSHVAVTLSESDGSHAPAHWRAHQSYDILQCTAGSGSGVQVKVVSCWWRKLAGLAER